MSRPAEFPLKADRVTQISNEGNPKGLVGLSGESDEDLSPLHCNTNRPSITYDYSDEEDEHE